MRGAGRDVWVKIRASEAERAEWHAKARSAGLTLSDLVRRSVGRVRPWTVAHAEVERERTRELARIGANLNQIARWANTFKANAEAVEIVAHLVAIERALAALAPVGAPTPMHIKFLARGTGSAGRRPTTSSGRGMRQGNCARAWRSSRGIPIRWPRWPTRWPIRAQVHVGRDCLGTGRHSDRRADRRGHRCL